MTYQDRIGLGLWAALQLLAIILKLTGVVSVGWTLVLAFTWFPLAIAGLLLFLGFLGWLLVSRL